MERHKWRTITKTKWRFSSLQHEISAVNWTKYAFPPKKEKKKNTSPLRLTLQYGSIGCCRQNVPCFNSMFILFWFYFCLSCPRRLICNKISQNTVENVGVFFKQEKKKPASTPIVQPSGHCFTRSLIRIFYSDHCSPTPSNNNTNFVFKWSVSKAPACPPISPDGTTRLTVAVKWSLSSANGSHIFSAAT